VRIVRAILAVVVAVSVAVLPATAGAVRAAQASERSVAEAALSAAMPVDCDHEAPARDRGSRPADDCATMAACAANCFNYAGTVVPEIAPVPTASRLQPIAATDLVVSKIGSPPFRPPRV
jgi:hypothetical protein